jgi:hypothetical protein
MTLILDNLRSKFVDIDYKYSTRRKCYIKVTSSTLLTTRVPRTRSIKDNLNTLVRTVKNEHR